MLEISEVMSKYLVTQDYVFYIGEVENNKSGEGREKKHEEKRK